MHEAIISRAGPFKFGIAEVAALNPVFENSLVKANLPPTTEFTLRK
jgi:hypothetical protein